MKILYFDCFSGISGDMTLGALLDLGVPEALFLQEMNKLNFEGYKIIINRVSKNGIFGTDVKVVLEDGSDADWHHEHKDEHKHSHCDHNHDQVHGHEHHELDHHEHSHAHSERNLFDIEKIIDESNIKQRAKDFSKEVFREIATAEAKVHNKAINEVHFHEVGAVDSIVDIVGVSVCLDLLGIDKVYSSPLHDGHGFVKCQHGTIPVPVPAVMEMLAGSNIPLISLNINTELVTPTGMGIIKCLTSNFGGMPQMNIEKVGYGMGKRDTGGFNALRVVIGSLAEKAQGNDEIVILETNIDNINPEILGYTMERLFENGALDVYHTPIYMKKNRPAVMLSVMVSAENEEKLVDILLKETTTLGIRKTIAKRYCLNRKFETVDTEWGQVRMKIACLGDIEKVSPEFEDCATIARNAEIPLYRVMEAAKIKYSKAKN